MKRLLNYDPEERPSAREASIILDGLRVKAFMALSDSGKPSSDVRPPSAVDRAVSSSSQPRVHDAEHWAAVQQAAQKRLSDRAREAAARRRMSSAAFVKKLIVRLVLALLLAAALVFGAAAMSRTYFSTTAMLNRMARALSVKEVESEFNKYSLWVKVWRAPLERLGIRFDETAVSVGALFYKGEFAQAYALAAREQREDLTIWLFDQLKKEVERAWKWENKVRAVLSAWPVAPAKEKDALAAMLAEALRRKGEEGTSLLESTEFGAAKDLQNRLLRALKPGGARKSRRKLLSLPFKPTAP